VPASAVASTALRGVNVRVARHYADAVVAAPRIAADARALNEDLGWAESGKQGFLHVRHDPPHAVAGATV